MEKTTRQFRYDLNQISYDYTVEVRNRFKGLVLIDRVPDELWTEVCDIVQETGIKTIPMEKKCKKKKMRQRQHKKRKLQANIIDEHRCKNPQQNFSKQNLAIHQKAHTT